MICPKCGTNWPDEMKAVLKFCGACGSPLEPVTQPLVTPETVDTASRAQIGQPGGELRFVTVVFADLAGFTAFAEDRAPDEVAKIVGDLLQRLAVVVEQHGGGVDKFLGDAVVATFGLPRPDPNAARNAVRAALAMQQVADQFNGEHNLSFGLRVGIHAGEVMFRSIGGSWTVMGDTVNTASRIQSTTTPGKVWISRPVLEEVRRFFVVLPRPAVELKGKRTSVQPYEVIEERRTPFVNLPPFVGREQEWQRLMTLLTEITEHPCLRLVILRGPAGVGKSRIAWELRDWIQRQPEIYRVNVVQYDDSERLPSHGLNAILRSRYDLPVSLSDAEVIRNLSATMPSENPSPTTSFELAVEFFAFVMGISLPGFRILQMDGKNRWEGIYLELKNWIETRAQDEPWVLFLEDAQKGDADTAAFLEWATRMDWRAPVLVIVTIRDEDFGPECYWYNPINQWVKSGRAEEMRIKEITVDALAQALVGMLEGEVPMALAQYIAEHTEGNPLFAIELVLLLKEREQLNTLISPDHISLPGSVREVMEARIERLGREGKELAKRGSLIGRRFTHEAVERIWDHSASELETGYAILHETETIYEEPSKLFAGTREEVFRHGRLHEAVLARIPRDERVTWLKELETWALSKLAQDTSRAAAATLLIPIIARSRDEQRDLWQASLWYEALGYLHSY